MFKLLADLRRPGELNVAETLRKASVVSDLITEKDDAGILIRRQLTALTKLSIEGYEDAKVCLSTLLIALGTVSKYNDRKTLELEGAWMGTHILRELIKTLVLGLQNGQKSPSRILYQMVTHILDCLYIILDMKDIYLKTAGTIASEYMDSVSYSQLKEISQTAMDCLLILKSALFFRHLPAQMHRRIESSLGDFYIWIKVDLPKALADFTQREHKENEFPIFVSNELASEVEIKDYYLGLQFTSFKNNPMFVIKTNTEASYDVSVCYKKNEGQTCDIAKILKFGIRASFAISNTISNIKFKDLTITKLAPSLPLEEIELALPIYRLDPQPLSNVYAQFILDSDITDLKVLVEKNMRPTFGVLQKEGFQVTKKNHIYYIIMEPSPEQSFYYLAIQPGDQIKTNMFIKIRVKIISKTCYTWHDNKWETKGCLVKIHPKKDALICECSRLSLIAGLVEETPYRLDLVLVVPLALTISNDGTTKICVLLCLLLAFLLLLFLSRRSDKYDRVKRFVSILPDNYPGDKFGYLVCVNTGARVQAGTDAAVGIKLYGTLNDARDHILSSATHDIMEGFGEDWFLIYETESLGKIASLDLWHDNAGSRANWFCDSILIYDLYHQDCYFFMVNDWITLSLKRFPHVRVYPSSFTDIISSSRTFRNYMKAGFRLSHLWLSTVVRHSRDPVSRVDRLAIILCFILVSATVSITLIRQFDDYIAIDVFSYSVTLSMVESSIYSFIPAAIVACLLMHMFRRSYKIIFYIEKKLERNTHRRRVTRVSINQDYLPLNVSGSVSSLKDIMNRLHYGRRHKKSNEATSKRTLAETVNLSLMPKPLIPVQLKGDEPNVIIKRTWVFITWITVAVIIIVCICLSWFLSMNLAPLKTKKWFTIVVFSAIFHSFVFLPLKIIFVSALLAVTFKRIIYKDIYTFDPKDGRQLSLFGNLKYLAKLVHLRAHKNYKPVEEVFREEHRHKMLRAEKWRRLSDLMIQLVFLVILGLLLSTDIPSQHRTNAHLRNLMKDFYTVSNNTEYITYLKSKWAPHLFKYMWYNFKPLSEGTEVNFPRKDWIQDSVSRVVGNVRLRQFRVKPGYCDSSVNGTSLGCAAPFSKWSQDSRDYLTYWKRDSLDDGDILIKSLRNWNFSWPNNDSNFYFEGITGQTYPSGGYIQDLGTSNDELQANIDQLSAVWWITHFTRAVLAHAKVYNVNTRLFTEVVLLSEHTVTGEILPTVVVHSVDVNVYLSVWLAIFIFSAVMLWVRIYALINFEGIAGFFKNWQSPCELLMAVVALSALLYLYLHHRTAPQYIMEYDNSLKIFQYFDFYRIAHYSYTARELVCFIYILTLLRFYTLWKFGRTVLRIFLTIVHSMQAMIWLTTIFILFQCITFRSVGYSLSIFIDVFLNPNMFYRCNYSYLPSNNEVSGYKVLCFTVCFSSVVVMVLFVCVFAHEFKKSRFDFFLRFTVVNFITFLCGEIMALFVKPKARQEADKTMFAKVERKKSHLSLKPEDEIKESD